jgi:hypothetical protein
MDHVRLTGSLLAQPITKGDDFRIICVLRAADNIVCEWTFKHWPEGMYKAALRHVLLDERSPTQRDTLAGDCCAERARQLIDVQPSFAIAVVARPWAIVPSGDTVSR